VVFWAGHDTGEEKHSYPCWEFNHGYPAHKLDRLLSWLVDYVDIFLWQEQVLQSACYCMDFHSNIVDCWEG
jgi:hypothetical protein